MRCCKRAQALEYPLRPLVFELVQLPALPGTQTGVLGPQHRFADLTDPLGRVRKVQNAPGLWAMERNPSLNPFRSITHQRDVLGRLDSSAVEFAEREPLKQLGFGH